jgi:glutathione S-transferase
MLDSPFVRRVAISAQLLGLEYEHNPLSIFRTYDAFRKLNPLVKVPTLVCDNGRLLVDSTLIIDYLETLSGNSLMPDDPGQRQFALQHIGTAMVSMEKVAQMIYETKLRPEEKQHAPWLERLNQQLTSALALMENAVGDGQSWMLGDEFTQADLTTAVGWRFVKYSQPTIGVDEDYPGLAQFSARAEELPEFVACPLG